MLSSNMLPCIIREFDHPPRLDARGSLPNLNALRLGGRCLGLLLPAPPPAVSTWDQAQGLIGSRAPSPGLDANCNEPEVAGWAWSWSWGRTEASPSLEASVSPLSPSPGSSESPDTPSPKASPTSGSSESPDTPSPKASPTTGSSESPDTPFPKASPTTGSSESPDTPFPKASPTTGSSESPASPSLGASLPLGPIESLASLSLGPEPPASTSLEPRESPASYSQEASPSLGPSESLASPALGAAPSPVVSRPLTSPSPVASPSLRSPTSPSPPSPSPWTVPSPEPSRSPPVPGSLKSTPSLSTETSPCLGPSTSPSPEASGSPASLSLGASPSPPAGPPSSDPSPPSLAAVQDHDHGFAGQGSDEGITGPRVTTFHELALRRRRAPGPRPPAPDPPPAQGVSGPPPTVVTFRELRWRGRMNGPEPQGEESSRWEGEEPEEQVEGSSGGRGKADGGAKPAREVTRTRHSTCAEWSGMAAPALTPPLRPPPQDGRPPPLDPHKKGLVWAVSLSVDEIVAHFSAARNIVQKTQLGDSWGNPRVGRILLAGLCPALTAVLGDGLRPYRQHLILGRRPSSPWSVVEASVKAGQSPRSLYNLYHQLDNLSELKNSQKKFNAFIFAMLNLKLLDFWIASLYNCTEVLKTHYAPTAFLCLAHTTCRRTSQDLLLLLQPLAVLTFQLDPLFEYHHHFPPRSAGSDHDPSVPEEQGPRRLGRDKEGTTGCPPSEGTSRPAAGATHPCRPASGGRASPWSAEDGYTLQDSFDQVRRWAGSLTRLALDLGQRQEAQGDPTPAQAGWWGRLGKSCQVYLAPSRRPLTTGEHRAELSVPGLASEGPGAQRDPATGDSELSRPEGGPPVRGPAGGPGQHQRAKPPLLASFFGARVPCTRSPGDPEPQRPNEQRGRLPSDWLRLNIEHLWRAPAARTGSSPGPGPPQEDSRAARAVRTLCDHQATDPGHLGFRRGETLEVIGCVDDAWIHCRRGDNSGLVPIEYTSLV